MSGAVLIVGATGNIGVSAARASLNTGRTVLAIVRDQASARKLYEHVGTRNGITVAEADVTSEHGVQSVVDRVRNGELPAFQHVYSAVGTMNLKTPIQNLSTSEFRQTMSTVLESNYFAYRATVPYLLEQSDSKSTWTLVTGAAGESGWAGVTAISQGALFSMANVACRELADTQIRFNEVYLSFRVDYDSIAKEKSNSMASSVFAAHYERLLANEGIKGCRISLLHADDVTELKYKRKL
ncbi:hypothetical protein K456DRAFT_1852879 [Colletotrichum gloeosporioides 23]|nr:hypothetical protein K456DRAFT_1852879 [Colletotrichum gloeosporioides 23]